MDCREMLYQGKRADNGEWVEGCLLIDYVTGQYFIHAKGNTLNADEAGNLSFFAYEIDPQTACEYTGFNGRKGRYIFENDLIGKARNRVVYVNGSWSVGGDRDLFFFKDEEIVGNYFDLAGEVLYTETAHFEDSETVDRFLEMEKQDPGSAVSFLSQWDNGENDGNPETLSRITEGLLYVNRAEQAEYMALWQTGVTGVTLYRRITEKEEQRNDGSRALRKRMEEKK